MVHDLSDHFSILFQSEHGVEPILIADQISSGLPRPFFPVRYVIGGGAGGESSRPVFKNELTGYNYEMKLTHPHRRNILRS